MQDEGRLVAYVPMRQRAPLGASIQPRSAPLGHRVGVRSIEGHGSCFAVVAGAVQCSGSQPREVEARPPSTPPA
jgi:hypothetical protein